MESREIWRLQARTKPRHLLPGAWTRTPLNQHHAAEWQQPWRRSPTSPGQHSPAPACLTRGGSAPGSPWAQAGSPPLHARCDCPTAPPEKPLPLPLAFCWQLSGTSGVDAAQSLSWDQTPGGVKVINVFRVTFCLLLKASAKFLWGVFIKRSGCLVQWRR